MRIEIGGEGRSFQIPVPRWLLSSRLMMRLVLEKCSVTGISPKAASRLCREIGTFAKTHPGWVLVEVESADGERVKITL